MRKKSKPSRSHLVVHIDIWSEEEINEISQGEEHCNHFEMASIADLDKPGVISVASTRKESEVKNHNAERNGEAENVSQPAHYRVRMIPEEPKSVRDHLRIARTKEEDSPWLTQIRRSNADRLRSKPQ